MVNIETHYEMTIRQGKNDEWNEELTGLITSERSFDRPKTDKEAINLANKTVRFFNKTLSRYEKRRRLVCVQKVETKVTDLIKYKK